MTNDEFYMSRCLQLATFAEGYTHPNPMVGAVIVCNGEIIGEGYHRRYGEPHAEVNAIDSVKNREWLKKSTMYVSLEPCSHWGKTPPCADLIVSCGIPRVVVGMLDPNPKVNGRGVGILQEAGVEVVVGVLEEQCRFVNRRFIVSQTENRPFVILKWAQTSDGFIDRERENLTQSPLRISNEITKTLNHQNRTFESAIMIATNTAIKDNPHLTSRKWSGRNPLRVVLDRSLRIPKDYKIFDQSTSTLIFNSIRHEILEQTEFVKIDFAKNIIPQVLNELHSRQIQSLIVEGGRVLLQSFIDFGLWDECYVELSPDPIGRGVSAPILRNAVLCKETKVLSNICLEYKNRQMIGV